MASINAKRATQVPNPLVTSQPLRPVQTLQWLSRAPLSPIALQATRANPCSKMHFRVIWSMTMASTKEMSQPSIQTWPLSNTSKIWCSVRRTQLNWPKVAKTPLYWLATMLNSNSSSLFSVRPYMEPKASSRLKATFKKCRNCWLIWGSSNLAESMHRGFEQSISSIRKCYLTNQQCLNYILCYFSTPNYFELQIWVLFSNS